MNRRDMMALIGGAAAWPVAARAQAMPVIGILDSQTRNAVAARLAAFRQGLKETGFIEGQNVAIEYRFADGQNDRLPMLAADLVRRKVNVIWTGGGTPAASATKAATTMIPIVFSIGNDPVQMGLVAGLNRPGGNLTGVTSLGGEVGPKRLELMHEVAPTATIIALLINPNNPAAESQSTELQPAARTLGLQLHVLHASAERDFDAAFASLVQLRAGGLVIGADAVFNTRSEQLAALTLHHAIPAIFQFRAFAAAGGLMSYGGSYTDPSRQAGIYTGRILKGEKPAELPVQQSTKVELVINLKTAKALGLTVPQLLLGRADEVIE
jgi:putative ABC transport system substrate-binding protein